MHEGRGLLALCEVAGQAFHALMKVSARGQHVFWRRSGNPDTESRSLFAPCRLGSVVTDSTVVCGA